MIEEQNNKNKKYAVLSILSTLFIICVNYVLGNSPYPIFDDINYYSALEWTRRNLAQECPPDTDVLYINVAYDKKLIKYNDPTYNLPLGNIDITDRNKLYQFLKIAKQCGNYKYIFLDVRFEKGYIDDSMIKVGDDSAMVDNLLFSTIQHTPRIVVSTHNDIELMADSIAPKTAINDYLSTITSTNFVRYRYLYDNDESVALRMYKDTHHAKYERSGPLYFLDGQLCSNCPFLAFEHEFSMQRENADDFPYYNLGEDILYTDNDQELFAHIKDLIQGKYVVIGNFVEDIHDTYVGLQPGSYITYMAFKGLENGKNIIQWWAILLFGIIYFITTFLTLRNIEFLEYFPFIKRIKFRSIRFLLTLIGFTLFMSVASGIIYFLCGITFSIWFPSLYFTALKTIKSYKKS